MAATNSNPSRMQRDFDQAIAQLAEQDKGRKFRDEDRPMNAFLDVFEDVTDKPIENVDQAEILQKAVAFFMEQGRDTHDPFVKGPYEGSIDDAIDAVLSDAIGDATTPFDTAILALARFRLQGQRKPSPNA